MLLSQQLGIGLLCAFALLGGIIYGCVVCNRGPAVKYDTEEGPLGNILTLIYRAYKQIYSMYIVM